MATVLKGKVDKIIITGGIAYSQRFVDLIVEQVAFIAPVEVVPGEEEMEALAFGACAFCGARKSARIRIISDGDDANGGLMMKQQIVHFAPYLEKCANCRK